MNVYIDISNLMTVNFLTGIQRVAKEIVTRLNRSEHFNIVLLSYTNEDGIFNVLDRDVFIRHFEKGENCKNEMITHKKMRLEDIEHGAVFFDIDSIWSSRMRRSYILPILKGNGVKVAVQIYDIIPITHPQYCHQNTTFFFMDYLGAYLNYADIIISSAETTKRAINELSGQLGLEEKPNIVVPLGSDFQKVRAVDETVDPEVKRKLRSKKYCLIVGTIEPRKNHAILLKAFEKKLFERDICLVFAGRIGWNVEELKRKIENHPELDKKFFFIQNSNDATIDYLYSNAFLTLFPTFNEGFGLPIIESIERGTPVVASDRDILKEVGRDFCEYFNPENEDELIALVEKYIDSPSEYRKVKKHLKDYVRFTWDQSAELMEKAICSLEIRTDKAVPKEIRQLVILSARDEMLLETIPFIENFMPFIKEIVICCPDFTVEKVKGNYNGALELKFLTDSMVLAGNPLPKDHACRNYYLRCMAFRHEMIDDAFLMCDDDYRPLHLIAPEVFVKDGKYRAHYCYGLKDWKGTPGTLTSYDESMFRLYKFLENHHYPTRQFSSHMPQAIDKRIFNEMLDRHPELLMAGCDEWSSYFNYGIYHYPDLYDVVPYVTMGWPGTPTDWEMQVIPDRFMFENFYPEMYEKGGLFEGFSTKYHEGIVSENVQKISLYLSEQRKHECGRAMFDMYRKLYNHQYGENPIFMVDISEKARIYLPVYVAVGKMSCNKIRFSINNPNKKSFRLEYYYTQLNGDRITMPDGVDVDGETGEMELPVFGIKRPGQFLLHVLCCLDGGEYEGSVGIILV